MLQYILPATSHFDILKYLKVLSFVILNYKLIDCFSTQNNIYVKEGATVSFCSDCIAQDLQYWTERLIVREWELNMWQLGLIKQST